MRIRFAARRATNDRATNDRATNDRATNDRAPSAGAQTPSPRRGITVRYSKVAIAALGLSLSAALTLGLPGASDALAAPSAAVGSSAPSGAVKVVSAAVPQSAAAAQASDPCKGRSQTYIVTTFIRGPEVFPLRCGTNTWGYNHLVYRAHDYNPALIALTVARGSAPVPGEQVLQWKWSTMTCPTYNYTYTVVYNQGALNGHGVRPQGIITAYESVTVTNAANTANTANVPKCG